MVGFALGAAAVAGAYWYRNRATVVLAAREEIVADGGIVLPKGTQLIHDTSMSEGFETLRLYVNVQTVDLPKRFEQRTEKQAFLVIPYWIR